MKAVTRRWLLSSLLAGAAAPVLAGAPARSLIPQPRPTIATGAAPPVTAPTPESLIEAARLGGDVSYLVADARDGRLLEAYRADQALPPASVIKALTALYALETLGGSHRFLTRLVATGPVQDGRLEGDLVLVGGGDPVLGTDALGDMAARLRDLGVRAISGRFIVHGGALPAVTAIDDDQPEHVGYNPAISGMILNFNRVHFRWQRSGGGYQVVMEAPDQRFRPQIGVTRMRVADRQTPVYTYSNSGVVDEWTVAGAALGNAGSRWLPVRHPEHYAGDAFRNIAAFYDIQLPPAQSEQREGVRGTALAEHRSDELRVILRDMMRFSTNITAEAVGLAASIAGGASPRSLSQSAARMTDWATARFGLRDAVFHDHSGLGDRSRLSAADMVRILLGAGADGALHGLMRDFPIRDARGSILHDHPVKVAAKTGTLNFVSGLGGYIALPTGPELAFAIFSADMGTRSRIPVEQRERPPGAREWAGRARRLQQQLIERWATVHG